MQLNETYPLNEEAWAEWVEFRTIEKRKKIGPLAKKKQVQMLCQYDPAQQQAIIDQSIMNSWQGLFPPKQKSQQVAVRGPQGSTRATTLIEDLSDTSWAN